MVNGHPVSRVLIKIMLASSLLIFAILPRIFAMRSKNISVDIIFMTCCVVSEVYHSSILLNDLTMDVILI